MSWWMNTKNHHWLQRPKTSSLISQVVMVAREIPCEAKTARRDTLVIFLNFLRALEHQELKPSHHHCFNSQHFLRETLSTLEETVQEFSAESLCQLSKEFL